MTQKLETIIEAIELSHSIFPQLDGYVEYFSTENYIANYSNDPHHFSNAVSCARLNNDNAEQTIKDIISFYLKKKLGFVWSVGPLSKPKNLSELLIKNSFEKIISSDGLYLDNLIKREVDNSDVSIKEIELTENCASIQTMADGFGMSLEASVSYHKLLSLAKHKLKLRGYAAYVKGADYPVGCAYLTNYPNQPIALLGGAVTLPDYQKRGIYTAMLNQRINDAIDDGIETVIILADSSSSAPICKKFGFKKACETELYKYCSV